MPIKLIRELQEERRASSTHRRQIVITNSVHNVLSYELELVVTAVRWVVDAVRAKSGPR